MATPQEIIVRVAKQNGIPDEYLWVPLTISWGESSWNPSASGDSGKSIGLFQIHEIHGISREDREDPYKNASYMMPSIAQALSDGLKAGLTGLDLLKKVWFESERPADTPAAHINMERALKSVPLGADMTQHIPEEFIPPGAPNPNEKFVSNIEPTGPPKAETRFRPVYENGKLHHYVQESPILKSVAVQDADGNPVLDDAGRPVTQLQIVGWDAVKTYSIRQYDALQEKAGNTRTSGYRPVPDPNNPSRPMGYAIYKTTYDNDGNPISEDIVPSTFISSGAYDYWVKTGRFPDEKTDPRATRIALEPIPGPGGKIALWQTVSRDPTGRITDIGQSFTPEQFQSLMEDGRLPAPPLDPVAVGNLAARFYENEISEGRLKQDNAIAQFNSVLNESKLTFDKWNSLQEAQQTRARALLSAQTAQQNIATERGRIFATEILPRAFPGAEALNIPLLGGRLPLSQVNPQTLFDFGQGPMTPPSLPEIPNQPATPPLPVIPQFNPQLPPDLQHLLPQNNPGLVPSNSLLQNALPS